MKVLEERERYRLCLGRFGTFFQIKRDEWENLDNNGVLSLLSEFSGQLLSYKKKVDATLTIIKKTLKQPEAKLDFETLADTLQGAKSNLEG